MHEVDRIWLKYQEGRFLDRLESVDEVNRFALTFGRDVAQTLRLLTLMRNPDRNPLGYGLSGRTRRRSPDARRKVVATCLSVLRTRQ